MLKAFRVLALLLAIEVVVQASMIAFALFGLGKWIEDDGGVLNKAVLDSDKLPNFTGAVGFEVHGMNGMMIIPLITIATLVVSFFTKVPGTAKRGGILFGLVALQVVLGMLGHGIVVLGPVHAINGFALFSVAVMTFVQYGKVSPGVVAESPAKTAVS